MNKVLVLDNYDSFTYNLVHMVREISGTEVSVIRNDKIDLDEVEVFSKVILSPGPGIPMEAGKMPELLKRFAPKKSILGVCLGHQCIGEVFGGELHNLKLPVHGKAIDTKVVDTSEPMFRGLPQRFLSGRYHSWVVKKEKLPKDLIVTAEDDTGEIMAVRHSSLDVRGVQFHPESVLTEFGKKMLENWLSI